MTMKMKLKMENGSRYDMNRPRPRHGHKYTKYKMCLSIMMVISLKQHLRGQGRPPPLLVTCLDGTSKLHLV